MTKATDTHTHTHTEYVILLFPRLKSLRDRARTLLYTCIACIVNIALSYLRPLGRPRRRWNDNIKTDLQEQFNNFVLKRKLRM